MLQDYLTQKVIWHQVKIQENKPYTSIVSTQSKQKDRRDNLYKRKIINLTLEIKQKRKKLKKIIQK